MIFLVVEILPKVEEGEYAKTDEDYTYEQVSEATSSNKSG